MPSAAAKLSSSRAMCLQQNVYRWFKRTVPGSKLLQQEVNQIRALRA